METTNKPDSLPELPALEVTAIAEVRKHLPNAPDDEWVKKHCPIEISFAKRMIAAESQLASRVTGEMPERPKPAVVVNHGSGFSPCYGASVAEAHFDELEAELLSTRSESEGAREKAIRECAYIALAPDYPRAPEGSNQNAFNAGLREYHRRILALLPSSPAQDGKP